MKDFDVYGLASVTYKDRPLDHTGITELAVYEVRGDGNDFIIKNINKAGEKIDKVKRKDVIGKSILKLFPEIKSFGVFDILKGVYKTGKPKEHPISFYKDDRISGWRRNYVFKLPSGEIVSVFDDKTRERHAEELLKISEEFSSNLMKNSPTPVLVLNADHSIRYMNPAFEKLLGFKLSNLMGKEPPFPWLPEDMGRKYRKILEEVSNKKVRFHSLEVLTKDEKTKYVDISASPVKDKRKLKYILINFVDVTERKKAEEEIIKNEQNLKAAQSIAHIGSYNWDVVNDKIAMSDELFRILSIDPKRFDGSFKNNINFIHPEDRESVLKGLDDALKNKKLFKSEHRALLSDNQVIFVSVIGKISYDESNKPSRMIGTIMDITERKKAEEEIIKNEQKLKDAQSIAHIGSFNWDLVTNKIAMSDEAYRILKINPKKFNGSFNTIKDLFHPEDKEFILTVIDNAIKNKKFLDIEHRVLLRDDTEIFIDKKAKPFCNESKKVLKFTGTMMDITERKKAELKLVKSEEALKKTLNGAINSLAAIVETKDPYTYGHQQRVRKLATTIAMDLGLDEKKVEAIRIASLIHDIGKVNIPASILSKPGKLTEIEFDMIKTHPQLSYNMLKKIDFPLPIVDIILQHHEKLDGSGYPRGLKGKDIMLEAKILTVADIVEAMSSHRPYRPALGLSVAIDEIRKIKGKLYDPAVADSCIKIITKKKFRFD